ncbi:unnamed protein product [Brachionus calyciflorus]|uniref:Uncharacterized protein n=1 Tax=Brachionus calyciflorus TaxID=104777 RepID=A0A813RUJ8_9BILA|nr:unnamed protein product [Brachionus calyciflorus]
MKIVTGQASNDLIINEFFLKTIKLIENRLDRFDRKIKRLKFSINSSNCSRYYRQNKLKRLRELVFFDHDEQTQLVNSEFIQNSDNENSSEGYYTSESITTEISILKNEDYLDSVIPLIRIDEIKKMNANESSVTIIWNLFNIKNKKFMNSNQDFLNSIQEYEIFNFCAENIEEEAKFINCFDRKMLDEFTDWEKIGSTKGYTPPVRCVLGKCSNGCIYFFAVRIKYKNSQMSQFSDYCRIPL